MDTQCAPLSTSIKKRDPFLDIIKGICVLSILCIHTAFWSGEAYTPNWFRSVTLWLDVPLFFFLSGWGSSLGKMGNLIRTCKGLWRSFFFKNLIFISVLLVIFRLTGAPLLPGNPSLLSNLSLEFSLIPFPVLGGSIWYIPYYLRAIVLNQFIIAVLKSPCEKAGYPESQLLVFLLLTNLLLFFMSCGNVLYLPFGFTQFDFFYNAIWLLGAVVGKYRVQIKSIVLFIAFLLLNAVIFVFSVRFLDCSLRNIQDMKFPTVPSAMLPWLFYSLFSILVTLFLRGRPTPSGAIASFFAHLGQNALYYFFAQGISSTIIYRFASMPMPHWFMRFVILYLINVALAIPIAEGLLLIEKGILFLTQQAKRIPCFQKLMRTLLVYLNLRGRND